MKARSDTRQIVDVLNVIRRNPEISMSRAAGYSGVHIGKLVHNIMPRIKLFLKTETHSPKHLTLTVAGVRWVLKAEEVLREIGGKP